MKMITKESSKGSGVSNKGTTLQLFNVNPDIKEALLQDNGYVQVYAGWRNLDGTVANSELNLIYSGDIVYVVDNRPNVDVITQVYMSDGNKLKQTTGTVNVSKGNTLESLYQAVVKEFKNVPVVFNLSNEKKTLVTQKGRNFSGNIAEILDNLTRDFGVSWYIKHHTIYVVDENKTAIRASNAYQIDLDQVKGYVDFSVDTTTTKASAKSKLNAKFTVRLDPRLTLGELISLEMPSAGGEPKRSNFIVEAVSHSLDMFGTTWDTTVECIEEGEP